MGGWEYLDSAGVMLSIVSQEFGAVLFNLICGSRLGDHDYYFKVTDSKYGTTADSISNASLSSMFVLFFTLHVFNGPYLNLWLVSVDEICVQTKPRMNLNAFTKFLRLVQILVAHLVAVGVAFWLIPALRDASESTLTWQKITPTGTPAVIPTGSPTAKTEINLGFVFLEEAAAVSTLLVGFLYLAWLRKPKNTEPPTVDIDFFMRLTLFVTACKRAFPSADLSPHVSLYRLFSQGINADEWAIRFLAGVVASVIVVGWDKARKLYKDSFPAEEEEEDMVYAAVPAVPGVTPPLNSNRPTTALPGGKHADFGSSLSISFAKQGTYF